MSFEKVKNTREYVFKPRVTLNNLIYLREAQVDGIKKFKFCELHIDKEKALLGMRFTNQQEADVFKVMQNGKNSYINIRSAMRILGKRLSSKFFIEKIKKEKGMYVIDLSDAK